MSEDQGQNGDVAAGDLTDELAKKYDPERLLRIVAKRAGKGEALDHHLRQRYEKQLGVDLGHVRLYSGEFAEEFNRKQGSYAVTIGQTGMIMMGNSPDKSIGSASGQALLAHELTHVAQQSRHGGGGLHRKSLSPMPFTIEDEHEAEENEFVAYQQALGVNAIQHSEEQIHNMMSPHARDKREQHLKEAIEDVHKRVLDMFSEAARSQNIRGGESRKA